MTRCGYIAIIGAPNAGKSTLLNQVTGSKIAIVTPKVQTTRNRILGITTHGESQCIFIDTPGIFNAREKFEKAMVASALSGARDGDVILLLVDAERGVCADTQRIIEDIAGYSTEKVLVLNKVDLVKKENLLALTQELFGKAQFSECFMISARSSEGVDGLMQYLAGRLPVSPYLYPEDEMTDMPLRFMAAEITREKLFMQLRQELPYHIAVETEEWKEEAGSNAISISSHGVGPLPNPPPEGGGDTGTPPLPSGRGLGRGSMGKNHVLNTDRYKKHLPSITVRQVIYVRSEGQKMIVIGKGGAGLKKVGEGARKELERMLKRRVHLFLFVKVAENWKENRQFYETIGLEW